MATFIIFRAKLAATESKFLPRVFVVVVAVVGVAKAVPGVDVTEGVLLPRFDFCASVAVETDPVELWPECTESVDRFRKTAETPPGDG